MHFSDLLVGYGKSPGEDYHISFDKDVPHKRTAPRSVPVHQEKVGKDETDTMLAHGGNVPVHKTTPWINFFVVSQSTNQMVPENQSMSRPKVSK